MLSLNYRSSSCIQSIRVNPVSGTVSVVFKGSTRSYQYKNVSRLAILNLMINPNMSLGFWVNHNLLAADAKVVSYA